MNVIFLMLGVTACYTTTSLADRYAAHDAKFRGNDFTFLMCASMSFFVACSLPFLEVRFEPVWQSFVAIILVAVCKYLEFDMSMTVMNELSAFELKAWLGVNMFVSYITEVIGGEQLRPARLGCIALTAVGLVLIVRSDKKEKPDYRRIILPLILYMLSKYGYSIIIKGFSPYISSTMQLLPAFVLLTLFTLIKARPAEIFRNNKKGSLVVIAARLPNAIGTLLENAVIAISITSYSFIQPMVLVSLFLIGLIRGGSRSATEITGSVICVVGIVLFALL